MSLDYDKNFKTIYLFPSTVLKQNTFNVAKFKYPKSIQILELNEVNNAIRLISEKELDTLGEEIGVSIKCQKAEIFDMMHRI